MKKSFFILFFFFIFFYSYSQDINFDLESQFFYYNYIKNETFEFISQNTTLTAFDAQEKIRIKYKNISDQIKFVLDIRSYLKPEKEEINYIVDSAYFSFENGPFILYAGKQRIKWGVGYTWNPSDRLQPQKDILNPAEDLEGFYALRLEYSNDFLTPSLIISSEPKSYDKDFLENIRFALQLYKLIGTVDFFINGIYQMNNIQTIGASFSWDVNLFILNLESAALRFMEPSLWNTRKAGIDGDKIDYSYLLGINKNIDLSTFITLEYYYNGWGFDNTEYNDYIDIAKILEFGNKKNYFLFIFSYTWEEKITSSLTFIWGADDSSFLLYPEIQYVENSVFNVELGFIENITDKNKETYYAIPLFNNLILKLKAYF